MGFRSFAALIAGTCTLLGCEQVPRSERLRDESAITFYDLTPPELSEKALVLPFVEEWGGRIDRISPSLRSDRDIVLAASRSYPQAALHLEPNDLSDPEFLTLLKENSLPAYALALGTLPDARERICAELAVEAGLFYHVDPKYRDDEGVVRQVVATSPYLFSFASERLRSDKDFVLAVSREHGSGFGLIRYATEELRSDCDFALQYLAICPSDVDAFPIEVRAQGAIIDFCLFERRNAAGLKGLLTDPALLSLAISSGASVYPYLSKEQQGTPETALACLEWDGISARCLPPELLADSDFLSELLLRNACSYPTIRDHVEAPALERLVPIAMKSYDAYQELGIDFGVRFDRSKEIIRNRYSVSDETRKEKLREIFGEEYFAGVESDPRPICIVLYPDSDFNGAFGIRDNIDRLTRFYKVIYYDVAHEDQLAEALAEASRGQPAELLVLGGHGTPTSLLMGQAGGDFGVLNVNDESSFGLISLAVAEGGTIVLGSCSTAGIVSEGKNLAESIHQYASHTLLFAPLDPTNFEFVLSREGEFIDPGYTSTNFVSYSPR
ncbi:MAG: DUF4116 domain-containing protein [Bdellovibrionales bacterium]|nr:DUF4116 domain-containing protein [Bdellovibrionales bacterium]